MLTYSQKKYLFAIYKLGQNGGRVKSTDIAGIAGVSKPSTALMLQKLADMGYIIKEPYGKITITDKGIKDANDIYTKCVIIKDFFSRTLGVSDECADEDAVAIVSHLNEDTAERFVEYILQSDKL